jgi:hypothetical protein
MRSFVRIKRLSIQPSVTYQADEMEKYSMAGVGGRALQRSASVEWQVWHSRREEATTRRPWLLSPEFAAARLGRATLFDIFRSLTVLAICLAALTGILLGRILRVIHIAALRRILPGGIGYVSGVILLALARILVLFGLVSHEFLL